MAQIAALKAPSAPSSINIRPHNARGGSGKRPQATAIIQDILSGPNIPLSTIARYAFFIARAVS